MNLICSLTLDSDLCSSSLIINSNIGGAPVHVYCFTRGDEERGGYADVKRGGSGRLKEEEKWDKKGGLINICLFMIGTLYPSVPRESLRVLNS